jgi:colicin import membrane protein
MKPVNVKNGKALLPRGLHACFLAGLLLAGTGAMAEEPATVTAPATTAVASTDLTPDGLTIRYPSGSIQSSETANRALIEVDQQRTVLDQKYAVEQHDCYEKFFATSCLDAAKERRRVALAQIRKVEIEANAFIRGDRVVQRDKNLAVKRGNDAANPRKPLAEVPVKPAAQSDADKAKENQQRIADNEAKLKQQQQDAISDAPKHAASLDAYNKKVQDAKARQRDVAKKKADKANQAAAKAAASAAASKTPGSAANSAASAASSQSTTPASSAPAASTPATKP